MLVLLLGVLVACDSAAGRDEGRVEGRVDIKSRFEQLVHELHALDDQIGQAFDAMADAQSETERVTARAAFDRLTKDRADAAARIVRVEAVVQRAEQLRAMHIPKRCLADPLAEGCN